MWNSSRRLALTSTGVVLTAGVLFAAAWFADWFPVRFSDPESGEIAETDESEALDFDLTPGRVSAYAQNVGPDGSDSDDEVTMDDTPGGQVEPGISDSSFSRPPNEFADRSSWPEEPGRLLPARTNAGRDSSGPSIPTRFPSITSGRRPSSSANGANRAPKIDLDTQPHQVIQQTALLDASTDASSGSGVSTAGGSGQRQPRSVFQTDASNSVRQSREFPAEVALLDRETNSESNPPASNPPADAPRIATRTTPKPAEDEQLDLAQIDAWIAAADYVSAHRVMSKAYWQQPDQRSLIMERLNRSAQVIYFNPQPHFLGAHVIQSGELLQNIAPKYKVSWQYLAALNRISDPRRIRTDQKLKVIKGPFSAFVDLSDFELTVHAHGFFVKRYAIGIGKDGSSPIGKFSVLAKIPTPQYTGPDGKVIEGGAQDNPLGTHWLDLGDSYGIHGTIDPLSIGKAESRGCVRLRNEDISEVYNFLTTGSEVVIRP